jgi:hypothetical protein
MYHSKILNRVQLYCFLKFVVHKLNSKMVKSEMVVLTRREKVDADGYSLKAAICCWNRSGREGERNVMWCGRE